MPITAPALRHRIVFQDFQHSKFRTRCWNQAAGVSQHCTLITLRSREKCCVPSSISVRVFVPCCVSYEYLISCPPIRTWGKVRVLLNTPAIMEEAPVFKSYEEEARYWRDCAERLKRQRDEARDELSEFYTSSKELEVELETQLQQTEHKASEYRTTCNRLKLELDAEREKNQQLLHDRDRDFENIHKELCQIKHMNSGLMRHVQDLEQKNDDLERAKRMLAVSLSDFEDKLNLEMERNAMLEVELGEKDRLSEMVQRLKDEVRDLRSELRINKAAACDGEGEDDDDGGDEGGMRDGGVPSSPTSTSTAGMNGSSTPSSPGPSAPPSHYPHLPHHSSLPVVLPPGVRCVCGAFQKAQAAASVTSSSSSSQQQQVMGKTPKMEDPLIMLTPERNGGKQRDISQHSNGNKAEMENVVPNGGGIHNSPLKGSGVMPNGGTNVLLTPSARISALNIVGDLLRKVGALESKLASCRSYSTESATNSKIPSRLDAQRFGKRIPRGTSSPNVQNLVRAGSTAS